MANDRIDTTTGWALLRTDGSMVVEVGPNVTEATIWKIGLGWPDAQEIAAHKRKGTRAFRCRIEEITNAQS